jgi:hypothetical protein
MGSGPPPATRGRRPRHGERSGVGTQGSEARLRSVLFPESTGQGGRIRTRPAAIRARATVADDSVSASADSDCSVVKSATKDVIVSADLAAEIVAAPGGKAVGHAQSGPPSGLAGGDAEL